MATIGVYAPEIDDAEFGSRIMMRASKAIETRMLSSKSKGDLQKTKKKTVYGIAYILLGVVVLSALTIYLSIVVAKGKGIE